MPREADILNVNVPDTAVQFYASFELVSLLNDTTKTLTEVSDLMHFENVSHFSRYVKKTLGKTPSEYRNK